MTTAHHRRKSGYSGNQTNCVEVGRVVGGAAVRGTKDRSSGDFTASHGQWQAFVSALEADR